MNLPPFLEFLRPRFQRQEDRFGLYGHIRVERRVGDGPLELIHDGKNFVVDAGLTGVRDILIGPSGAGFSGSIFRMAVGDGGSQTGALFTPKEPDATWPARTELYHEVFRKDIATFTKPSDVSARFVANFQSTDVDTTSFSLVDEVINEAALIIGDGVLTVGGDPKEVNKTPPDTVDADELMFSMRTFKSAPFSPSEDVTISITWTITVAR